MKNKKLVKSLSLLLLVAFLISLFVISSSADDSILPSADAGFESTPYYLVVNDWFTPPWNMDEFFPLQFTTAYNDSFMYWDTLLFDYAEGSYDLYYISFTNDVQELALSVASDGITYYNDDLRYLNVINVPEIRSQSFLDMMCLEGFDSGTYYFNQSPVFNRATSFDASFSPSFIYNNNRGGEEIEIYAIDYYQTPSVALVFDGTYVYSTSEGFVSGWDGKITFTGDVFITSVEGYELLKTIFLPFAPSSVTDAELDKAYDDGYRAGQFNPSPELREEIYDQGYGTGYGLGYTAGYNTGLNANETAVFGESLLGQTIQVPFETVMNIKLFTLPNGNPYTIGSAFGSIVALTLFIVFLKLFAGG